MNLTKTVNAFLKNSRLLKKVIKTKRTYLLASKEVEPHDICDEEDNEVVEGSTVDESAMFHCPELECVKQYLSWGRLQRHIAAEKYTFQTKNEPVILYRYI